MNTLNTSRSVFKLPFHFSDFKEEANAEVSAILRDASGEEVARGYLSAMLNTLPVEAKHIKNLRFAKFCHTTPAALLSSTPYHLRSEFGHISSGRDHLLYVKLVDNDGAPIMSAPWEQIQTAILERGYPVSQESITELQRRFKSLGPQQRIVGPASQNHFAKLREFAV